MKNLFYIFSSPIINISSYHILKYNTIKIYFIFYNIDNTKYYIKIVGKVICMIQNLQYKNKSNINECFYFSQNSNIECINSTIKCIGFELFHYFINFNDFLSFVVFTDSPKKPKK